MSTSWRRENMLIKRVLVANLIPHLSWRHHGIGALQAYVHEAESPGETEVRIHIWHPSLLIPGMEDSGQIHDHRFDLQSDVLLGEIEHVEYLVSEDDRGDYRKFSVVNARKGETPTPTPLPGRFSAHTHSRHYESGCTYFFKKRQFHLSRVSELTVTLVTKSNQEELPAIILSPALNPKMAHGFSHAPDEAQKKGMLEMAVSALRKENALIQGEGTSSSSPSRPCAERMEFGHDQISED